MVTDLQKLRLNYLGSPYSKLDIVSLVPTDIAYFFFPSKCDVKLPCPVIFRLNRLFRFHRLNEFFQKTESRTNFPNGFRIGRVILYILIIIHWNACFYFGISYFIGFGSDGWVYKNITDGVAGTLSRQYVYRSFLWFLRFQNSRSQFYSRLVKWVMVFFAHM